MVLETVVPVICEAQLSVDIKTTLSHPFTPAHRLHCLGVGLGVGVFVGLGVGLGVGVGVGHVSHR